ncbi:MAG: DnaK suppressor protein [Actinomycetota bacterium]|nr:DnaK suppressor protein [Actinomycetota bacterium]
MTDPISHRLLGERDAALAQLAALSREYEAMVASSEASNADDEHDPEGATIGFERAQLAATIEMTRIRLADLDRALSHVESGSYGTCETCGGDIGAERLAARPSARTCISCAR